MVTQMEIRSTVICYHQSGMKPKEIALEVNLPRRAVVDVIKSGKKLDLLHSKKVWKWFYKKLTKRMVRILLQSLK